MTIELTNTEFRLSGFSRTTMENLRNQFSYVHRDETRLGPDGRPFRNYLISEAGTGSFGILRSVLAYMNKLQPQVTFRDRRTKYVRMHDWKLALPLRTYQRVGAKFLHRYRWGFESAAPRAGKTRILAEAYCRIGLSPIVILANTSALAAQNAAALAEAIPQATVGLIGGGTFSIGDITSATYQSIYRALGIEYDAEKDPFDSPATTEQNDKIKDLWRHAKVISVDEGRIVVSPSLQNVLAQAKATLWRISADATPWTETNEDWLMEAMSGPVLHVVGYDQLISEGVLMRPKIRMIQMPSVMWPNNSHGRPDGGYSRVYSQLIVHNEQRNEMIANWANLLNLHGKSCFIPVAHISQGKELNKRIPGAVFMKAQAGVPIDKYTSILDSLRRKEILTLITTISTAGLDVPSLDCVLVADGFQDSRRNLQRLRQITFHKNKPWALHVDFMDQGPWISGHAQARLHQYKQYRCFETIEQSPAEFEQELKQLLNK